MNYFKKNRLHLAVASAALLVGSELAWAQQRAQSIEEVIVTSRRVEESQQDVPLAITAFNEATLREAGIGNLGDLKAVPSFTLAPLTGRRTTLAVQLRGQRTADANNTVDPAVGVYIAEVPIMRPYGLGSLSALDVQSMEVVKGPQGTLFGRNTTGGALLINPNAPTQTLGGSISAGIGNYNLRTVEGVFNAPITDTLAARIAVRTADQDGLIENRSGFHDINDEQSKTARLSFLWEPTDSLTNTTFIDSFTFKTHSGGALTALNSAPSTRINALYGAAQAQAILDEQQAADFWSTTSVDDTPSEIWGWGVANITSYDLSDSLTIKNVFGARSIDNRDENLHAHGFGLPLVLVTNDVRIDQYSNELQLQGSTDNLQWITGLFWFTEMADEGADRYTLLPTWPTTRGPARSDIDVKNTSYSAFGEGTYSFNDQFSMTLGLRWTVDDRELEATQINYANPASPVCQITADDAGTIPLSPCRVEVSEKFESPSYNISFDYRIDDSQLVYIAHRMGYRSGGFTQQAQRPAALQPFDEEVVKDLELGYKADLDLFGSPLRFNAAYYYSDYKDIQRNIAEFPPGSTIIVNSIKNAGAATIQGLELETTWLPTDALELGLFYTYTDAKYDEFDSAVAGGGTVDLSSNDFAPVPEHQGGLNATYTVPMGEAGELRINVSGYWQSRIAGNTVNKFDGTDIEIPGVFQSGYGLYNARISWNDVFGQPLSLSLWGRNLTDTEYYTGTSAQYESFGYSAGYFGNPRTYGLEARYTF